MFVRLCCQIRIFYKNILQFFLQCGIIKCIVNYQGVYIMDLAATLSENSENGSSVSVIDKIIGFEPSKKICAAVFFLFVLLLAAVSYFHEPWLDEAQAWMIARDASYHDMIFVIPHYEGHPFVWSVILSVPAKLGMPYELSLSIIMMAVSSVTAYLIIFKSPFCGWIKLLLPFTYFFFFQYGMIARPYGLMTLGFMLAAMFFKDRDKKPFRFVLALVLICSSTAYGIVLSGGIAAAWCLEILKEYGYKLNRLFTEFVRTRRFAALLVLLIIALLLVAEIVSYDETFTNDTLPFSAGRLIKGLWYMLFMLPADSMLFGTKYGLGTLLKYQSFAPEEYLILSITGIPILLLILELCRQRGKLLTFILPYMLFAAFGSAVYFISHHEGTAVVFYVFIIWICLDDKEVKKTSLMNSFDGKIYSEKNIRTLFASACIILPMLWSLSASVTDIRNDYDYGRAVADYLKETGLDKLNIMASWYYEQDPYGYEIISADKQHSAVTVSPYFDENIFFNFNYGDKSKAYILHRLSEEANEEQYELWRETIPDILIGEPNLHLVYSKDAVKRTDYILIKTVEYKMAWKLNHSSNYFCIYMRKDLFDDYPDIQPENPYDLEFLDNLS